MNQEQTVSVRLGLRFTGEELHVWSLTSVQIVQSLTSCPPSLGSWLQKSLNIESEQHIGICNVSSSLVQQGEEAQMLLPASVGGDGGGGGEGSPQGERSPAQGLRSAIWDGAPE